MAVAEERRCTFCRNTDSQVEPRIFVSFQDSSKSICQHCALKVIAMMVNRPMKTQTPQNNSKPKEKRNERSHDKTTK